MLALFLLERGEVHDNVARLPHPFYRAVLTLDPQDRDGGAVASLHELTTPASFLVNVTKFGLDTHLGEGAAYTVTKEARGVVVKGELRH